jgi:hypothetical protein
MSGEKAIPIKSRFSLKNHKIHFQETRKGKEKFLEHKIHK